MATTLRHSTAPKDAGISQNSGGDRDCRDTEGLPSGHWVTHEGCNEPNRENFYVNKRSPRLQGDETPDETGGSV